MRHLVLVVSLVLLVASVRISAVPPVAERIGDHAMDQEPQPRRPRVRPEAQAPPVRTPPVTADPAPGGGAPSATPVIAADGAVETLMPDGSTRRARPGDCGWTIVHPDGRKNTVTCATNVPRADLPVPDGASGAWLVAHGDSLLQIARTLLGGNAASLENYLKTVESEGPGIYDRIRLRTDLITKLTGQ